MLLFTILFAHLLNLYSVDLVNADMLRAVDELMRADNVSSATAAFDAGESFSKTSQLANGGSKLALLGLLYLRVDSLTAPHCLEAATFAGSGQCVDFEVTPAYKIFLFFVVAFLIVCALVGLN